jgi:hypothetical protein
MKPYFKTSAFPYPYCRSTKNTSIYGKRSKSKTKRILRKKYRLFLKMDVINQVKKNEISKSLGNAK